MVLVDTSSWIEALRVTGKSDVRSRVTALLANGEAAWCDIVRLELWNGARGQQEKKSLRELEQSLHNFKVDEQVWEMAIKLADRARSAGISVPADDLIITSCAQRYGVELEHNDAHFKRLFAV
jgi:predicted nucleic acid-binding protein